MSLPFESDPEAVIWNEVECGDYEADLPLWEELAASLSEDDAIMELGCGAGRVVRHLAARLPNLVIGLDRDPNLVQAVWEKCRGTSGDAEVEDVRDFGPFGTMFSLILAPMQLIQLLGGSEERGDCLRCTADCMDPGSRAAFAIVEELQPAPQGSPPPLPDVRQVDGWIYSSLPLEPVVDSERILLRRLRQTVDPDGNMDDEMNEVELWVLSAEELEGEATEAGLLPAGRREIAATEAHVGSTVVLLEKAP
ncbi:MAG TPA: class I SAM-dependent methyltransferase [Solirubrobacterales bacterium]